MPQQLFLVLRRRVADLGERAEGRYVREVLVVIKAANVEWVRLAVENAPRGADGIVLRQAERRGDVVCRAHRDIANLRRILKPHQSGQNLAERSIPADAADYVKIRAVFRRKLRRVAAAGGEEQCCTAAAFVEQIERVAQPVSEAAAPRRGIYYKHQPCHAAFSFFNIFTSQVEYRPLYPLIFHNYSGYYQKFSTFFLSFIIVSAAPMMHTAKTVQKNT